jgi:hypothetical protein
MKTSVSNFFRSRITQACLLLAFIATVATFAVSNQNDGSAELGGTWVGRLPGSAGVGDVTWIGTYSSDSSGRNATGTLEWITPGDYQPLLLRPFGVEKLSIASGVIRMTGKNTAVADWIWYLEGPTATKPVGDIIAIAVMSGDLRFTGPNTLEGTYRMKVYLTNGKTSMAPTDDMSLIVDQNIKAVSQRVF